MDFNQIISKKVSFQPNAWSAIEGETSIGDVIKSIKRGKYQKEINLLRSYLKNNDIDKYSIHKKRLPGVTFCARFDGKRRKEFLSEYHKVMVIDIDKLTIQELDRVKNVLTNDKFVFSFWTSPSEKGIKGLVFLDYDFVIEVSSIDQSHKWAFDQLTFYFKNTYNIDLDISGSDTTRLCFLSYDPELVFKETITPFAVKKDETGIFQKDKIEKDISKKEIKIDYVSSVDVLMNPKGKNDQRNKRTIIKIIKYLKKNKLSITSTYDEWYRVAYAIANSFTHDIGEKFYLSLCELDGASYDEHQSKNMLLYCYHNTEGNIMFSTLTYMAQKKGFKI